jgi:hypothetical protein
MALLPSRQSLTGPLASPLAPSALNLAERARASWTLVFLVGAAGICANAALGYFILLTGALTPWIVAPFLGGLVPAIVLSRIRSPVAPALILFIAAFPALGFAFTTHVAAFGRIVDLERVPDVPADLNVGGYAAPGWRLQSDDRGETHIHARNGPGGTLTVAPLTPPGWSPDQPVKLWLVGVAFASGKIGPWHPAHWATSGEYPRLAGALLEADAPDAVRNAAAAHGLTAAAEPVFVVRADNAAEAMSDQALLLGKVLAAVLVLWAIVTFATPSLAIMRRGYAR